MTNTELIQHFYTSFQNGDANGMVECYDENIIFQDPAFGRLTGEDARNMWRMLLERSKGDLKITFSEVNSVSQKGSANWKAEYTFSQTGRKVINTIHAEFEFREGKIAKHIDDFSLWNWSRQALGWKGFLFGKTRFMRNKIQKQTNSLLRNYVKKRNNLN